MTLYNYIKNCVRKRSFRTEVKALNFGRRWHQRAYECPSCGKWHLTSRKEKR